MISCTETSAARLGQKVRSLLRKYEMAIGCFFTLVVVALLVLGFIRWLHVYAPHVLVH